MPSPAFPAMPLVPARLQRTENGTPYSQAYGDVYHSSHGGPEQAHRVFLAGNGLPERWRGRENFAILETGFGLGLNFLATWTAWASDPERCRRLHFISLEKHPFAATDLALAHADWPQFAAPAAALRQRWPTLTPGRHRVELAAGQVVLTLVFGDAVETLPQLAAGSDIVADAFYLDGFSPAKNPELWSPALFRSLAQFAAPQATLATWSVAGHVRTGLAAAGFSVKKHPGFTGKRQMLCGRYRNDSE